MPKDITVIDMVPVMKRASKAVNPKIHMEVFKTRLMKRLADGEHIHLQGDPVEECLTYDVDDRCWEGIREIKRT